LTFESEEETNVANYKYIIIGGGIAGGKAVEGIRQIDEQGSIALITRAPHPPYQRPPLSKAYLKGEADLERLYLRDKAYYRENEVQIIKGLEILKIDPDKRQVYVKAGAILGYEKLLLATGGEALRLEIPGNHLENVFTLRSIADSDAIRKAAGKGKTALVMGASFIGSEVAASLTEVGTDVIQIFPEPRLLERIVPEEVSAYLHDLFKQHGVRIIPETVAESLEGDEAVRRAELSNGEEVAIDLVVMGVGINLNVDLAKEAGLELRESDLAVIVDQTLRSSDEHIYAAGDIAAWLDTNSGKRLQVEHWDVARQQGQQAGRNMAGENHPYTALPYFFSDLFDLSFEVWGNLDNWEQTVKRGNLSDDCFAIYYFEQGRLCGVLSVARPDEEREPMQALVKARPIYSEIAAQLENENTSLADLAGLEADESQATEELSFAEDIAPLFREMDVQEMKDTSGFDLSNYEDVKARAQHIYERLADRSMPCDEPWPEAQIQQFKQWIETGSQP
jgi:NADPH-dependent 2,4-dienoyl-CoA reductase/sulfur reductase-like enzyme